MIFFKGPPFALAPVLVPSKKQQPCLMSLFRVEEVQSKLVLVGTCSAAIQFSFRTELIRKFHWNVACGHTVSECRHCDPANQPNRTVSAPCCVGWDGWITYYVYDPPLPSWLLARPYSYYGRDLQLHRTWRCVPLPLLPV
jgi:hypothetical protein